MKAKQLAFKFDAPIVKNKTRGFILFDSYAKFALHLGLPKDFPVNKLSQREISFLFNKRLEKFTNSLIKL
ncbi:hypothetical protein LCGC14_0537000 [marine sediment metagenome]|uniref:Uncharacterized protein n=1 Tax=marine sediment metagenome TaxID=412755 RepID=A0A0F9RU15_9ZZZZ